MWRMTVCDPDQHPQLNRPRWRWHVHYIQLGEELRVPIEHHAHGVYERGYAMDFRDHDHAPENLDHSQAVPDRRPRFPAPDIYAEAQVEEDVEEDLPDA